MVTTCRPGEAVTVFEDRRDAERGRRLDDEASVVEQHPHTGDSMRTTSAPPADTGWWCTPRGTTYSCPGPKVTSSSSKRMVSVP